MLFPFGKERDSKFKDLILYPDSAINLLFIETEQCLNLSKVLVSEYIK